MTKSTTSSILHANSPAKVAVVSIYPPKGTSHPEAGGVASYTHNLCRALERRGDDVTIICDIPHGGQPVSYTEQNIRVIRVFRKNLLFFVSIARAARQTKANVLHVQQELSLYGGIASAFLLPLAILFAGSKLRKVITLHAVVSQAQVTPAFVKENNSTAPPFAVKAAFRLLYAWLNLVVSGIIVHEEPFKQRLIDEYRVNPQKVSVIPHGVEMLSSVPADTAKKALGIEPKTKVLLFLGYLTGYKGIDLLIEGYAKYLEHHPDARTILLVGAGKHPKLRDDPKYLKGSYERLKKKAQKMLPEGSYVWAGFVPEDELQTYYSAADLSVFPYTVAMSSSGPMAMSIAYQVPFIASDLFAEFFDYENHFFERTPESLAAVIGNTLDVSDGSDLVRRLRAERDWKAVAEKHAAAYGAHTEVS